MSPSDVFVTVVTSDHAPLLTAVFHIRGER
jgi:hypothetical protein